jgi:NitT/TauT family transport system substrate-binding protein
MARFVIQPHGRLQEVIADRNGYFAAEGLDYVIEGGESFGVTAGPRNERGELLRGAYESYVQGGGNKGGRSDISCACHWAVNQASASNVGRMWGGAYVFSPAAVMVPADSAIRGPEDLKGREIAVGYHSGSHFSTLQALEPFLAADDIQLRFLGRPWERVDAAVRKEVAATSVWGITYLTAEQLGLRKVVDCSFMMAFMFPPEVDVEDIGKYMNGLRRAQTELDLYPEKYKHHYASLIPERYRAQVDARLFSSGERIVFLPYTEDTFNRTQDWIRERALFDTRPESDFDSAVCS